MITYGLQAVLKDPRETHKEPENPTKGKTERRRRMAVRINLSEFDIGWTKEHRVGVREWLRVRTMYREIFYGSLIVLGLTTVFSVLVVASSV
jgi:hypothetical protein